MVQYLYNEKTYEYWDMFDYINLPEGAEDGAAE